MRLPIVFLALVAGSTAHDLVEALTSDPELSTLLGAIQAVPGLADTLNNAEGITIFAPVNSAFDAIAADSPEGQAIAGSDVDGIASILSYHVVPASIPSTAITEKPQFVQSLLTSENIFAGGPASLVTGGQYIGAAVVGTSVKLTSGLLKTSTVTVPDIEAGGAIVHKIDSVLTIPRTASATVTAAGFTSLADALTAAALVEDVDEAFGVTVFVPTNEAFAAIANTTATLTFDQLQAVLEYHITQDGVLYSPIIPAGETILYTLQNEGVTVNNDTTTGTITVNDATVVTPDVILKNGVGHVIDAVLIPEAVSGGGCAIPKRKKRNFGRKRLSNKH